MKFEVDPVCRVLHGGCVRARRMRPKHDWTWGLLISSDEYDRFKASKTTLSNPDPIYLLTMIGQTSKVRVENRIVKTNP